MISEVSKLTSETQRAARRPLKDMEARERLLETAILAFADSGFEATSVRSIAEAAGVAFQLITYYFGTKDALWSEAVDLVYRRSLERGRSLGFDLAGDLREQFRIHLRVLLSSTIQHPEWGRIITWEYLTQSTRYHKVILPKLRESMELLAKPYFQQVAKLGIVTRFSASEMHALWRGVTAANLTSPDHIAQLSGLPVGSARFIDWQIELIFSVLIRGFGRTINPDGSDPGEDLSIPETATIDNPAAVPSGHIWGEQYRGLEVAQLQRLRQLEIENEHLKQIVGELVVENRMLQNGRKGSLAGPGQGGAQK